MQLLLIGGGIAIYPEVSLTLLQLNCIRTTVVTHDLSQHIRQNSISAMLEEEA